MQSIAVPKFWAANPFPVLSSLLRAMIRFGQLTIIDARGRIRDFGDHRTGPSVERLMPSPVVSQLENSKTKLPINAPSGSGNHAI